MIVQIHGDLRDALEVPANSDWINGRFILPILFAHDVDHPDQERFETIRKDVSNPLVLKAAQEILVRWGALSYGLYQIQQHAEKVDALRTQLHALNQREIKRIFDELIVPAEKIVDAAAH